MINPDWYAVINLLEVINSRFYPYTKGPPLNDTQVTDGVAADNAPAEATTVALDALAPIQHAPVKNNTRRIEIAIIHIRALNPELPFCTTMICGCWTVG